ncbi:YobI family P-loop NTPase [Vibrio casei]|uniref:ATP-binding protein n=1 Tax=Vibrio casei TaxID=673372 RepID=A0A368LP57_9VIBR|nr:P-loop NTPase fold protein [Vibrio casei]RCS73546.1 ATP-binding protein [Vibrio casei]SJN25923.1 DNA-binding protein [Vibrio casei]
MTKLITSLIRRLSDGLNHVIILLERKQSSPSQRSKFVDLAPTDEADKQGIYAEAIEFAMNSPKVFNIAITGPYGSGKSSIIQSFLKRYKRDALQISLATFISEAEIEGGNASRQEIERSILQQMLYGADANKLPLSRFKRIQSPGITSLFKSLFITLGMLSISYVLNFQKDIVNGDYFTPFALENWLSLSVFSFAIVFLWGVLHSLYVASFGLSLKGISLKNVELKPANDDETSILNKHLDEIIYFFQRTNYNLVIIEDLDRFNNAEIFVTLREINNLVNANSGVKQHIRFLYALRDDIFVNTERTKFFEFIIPVIPIINTSNSIDMVLAQGQRLSLDDGLDRQFVREVSRYLNDLRLIQNIFNEYKIYVANLETEGENLLDTNKLLAVLIYKNVYPKDFEQLHRGLGTLAKILDLRDKLVEEGEREHRNAIIKLEKILEAGERQVPVDLKELRNIYAMAFLEKLPSNAYSISISQNNAQFVEIFNLASSDKFEQIIESKVIYYKLTQNHYLQSMNLDNLQNEVNSLKSYQQRKKEIEAKAAEKKNKILSRIRDFRPKIASIRTAKLNELLRVSLENEPNLFDGFGENGELARFLILEGYLDDTYYQYTSLFHSGRMSPNDNKFLIQIRAFITPEPDFPIDNPHEVIAAMRNEDFEQSYVLNVAIVDSLLSDSIRYQSQIQKLLEYIMTGFESCEGFLGAYYSSGNYVKQLLTELSTNWNSLIPEILSSPYSKDHVMKLISNVSIATLRSHARDFEELPAFVQKNLSEILLNLPELEPERITCLDFEVKDLSAIHQHSSIVNTLFEEGLFSMTIENIEFIFEVILVVDTLEPLHKSNYTVIRATGNKVLNHKIEHNFSDYLNNVLLLLKTNTEEDSSAIQSVLNHDDLELRVLKTFIDQQMTKLQNLDKIPERMHPPLFESNKIQPSWKNCLSFMESPSFSEDALTRFLDIDDVRTVILKEDIPRDEESKSLRSFILRANSLTNASYSDYIQALPSIYKAFPSGLESEKIRILIDKKKVEFSEHNFDSISEERDLQIHFIASYINEYLTENDEFLLSDDYLESLLETEIPLTAKLKVIEQMDLSYLSGNRPLSELIANIIVASDSNLKNIDEDTARDLIISSSPIETQISILNKYHTLLSDDEVRHILTKLPDPYCDIKTGYSSPRLINNQQNQELVRWLESRNIISTWKKDPIFDNKIKVNLLRR